MNYMIEHRRCLSNGVGPVSFEAMRRILRTGMLALTAALVSADVVELKDEASIKGRVIAEKSEHVAVDVGQPLARRAVVEGIAQADDRLRLQDIDQGRLVDADLDCAETVRFAADFLPEPAGLFGRASKPGSHRLFWVGPQDVPSRSIWADPPPVPMVDSVMPAACMSASSSS